MGEVCWCAAALREAGNVDLNEGLDVFCGFGRAGNGCCCGDFFSLLYGFYTLNYIKKFYYFGDFARLKLTNEMFFKRVVGVLGSPFSFQG